MGGRGPLSYAVWRVRLRQSRLGKARADFAAPPSLTLGPGRSGGRRLTSPPRPPSPFGKRGEDSTVDGKPTSSRLSANKTLPPSGTEGVPERRVLGRGRSSLQGTVALTAIVLLATVIPALAEVDPSEGPVPALERTVPDFALQRIGGGVMRLTDIEEPVVVLNIFAFWCDTWIQQLPQLRELVARQNDLDFRLIAVSIDGRWSAQLQQVCDDDPPAWPVLLDGDRVLAKALGIRHAPTVLVLDRSRKVLYAWEGYPGNHRVLRGIRRALSEDEAVR